MSNQRAGLVERIYASSEHTHIKLQIPDAESPTDGYFSLEVSHTNYQALYSLALSAAINRYPLHIRTRGVISPNAKAFIHYMFVDW